MRLRDKRSVEEVEWALVSLVFHVSDIVAQPPVNAFSAEQDVAIFALKGLVGPMAIPVSGPGLDG